MVTEMMSHWPLRMSVPVDADARDADGFLTEEGIAVVFAVVRDAYLEGCATLSNIDVVVADLVVERGSVAAPGGLAVAAAAVNEVFPDHFTMTTRIRPADGPGVAGSARCTVRPDGGVTREIQAELIARAQTARHFH
jgi:hypothetical protein